jgi:hypothetical protein
MMACGMGEDAAALIHGSAATACCIVKDEAVATLVHGPAAATCGAREDAAVAAACVSGGGDVEVEVSDYRGERERGD